MYSCSSKQPKLHSALLPQEEKLLTLLEDAYLGARYASSYKIGSDDLETIFVRVSRLLDLAELTFRERMGVVSGLADD